MMQPSRNIILLSLTGLTVLILSLIGGKAVPIYDGVGFPDEPYRYVKPPASQKIKTAAPTIALAQISPDDINNNINGVYVTSQESGPQIAINLSQNSLIFPSQTKTIEIKAVPLAPSIEPGDGTIAGNVYRLSITSDAGSVKLSASSSSNYKFVDLRLPQGFPSDPIVEFRTIDGSWQRQETSQVGNDIYETQISDLGDYALVIPKQVSSAVKNQRRNKEIWIVLAIIGVLAMSAIIFFVRLNSKRSKK